MSNKSYKSICEFHEIDIDEESIRSLDLISNGQNSYHVLQNGKSYHASIISVCAKTKSYTVEIDGNKYDILIKDTHDMLIEEMGLSTGGDQKIDNISAPMPGLILDINVKEGDEIHKGDPLFILEAMKMENVIKASGDGVIKRVGVSVGETVDKGELILEME